MGFLETPHVNNWSLWTPLIGWFFIYIGLQLRITQVEKEE
ncbi:hypothetical protein EV11_0132 [Prochlorococcus sp. SS52]|nr:hypothetical protein EV04_1970 [Prochlorococcus marinus str. LG]KGG22610.1 hypothetical protein EV08_0025 [Prochlorococcus marinus str. SS2]KGG37428.1 hypothetical protein EV11_0132 [Prochlorococcus sp. SS52]